MISLSYTLTSNLQSYLSNIEKSREIILLTPISPQVENRLKWEATLQKVYWSLTLSDSPLTKAQMQKILYKGEQKRLKKEKRDVLNYKTALDHIKQNWNVTDKQVTSNTLKDLYLIACKSAKDKNARLFVEKKKDLNAYLEYLQSSYENPVIQAGISMIQIIKIAPFASLNDLMSRLSADLFLYKHGYDFRGLLVYERYLRSDLMTLKNALKLADKSLTKWLEYFTYGVAVELKKVEEEVKDISFKTDIPASFWKLNERQKQILLILEKAGSKMTNRDVQKEFKISQITASRDLSKLLNLGLVLSIGKARSRFYIKA
jgi:Fic family protein